MVKCYELNQNHIDMKKITLADLFLKHLSNINSELADQIKMVINSPDVAELLSVAIADALGVKQAIRESVVDNAVDYMISFSHHGIDKSFLEDNDKEYRKKEVSFTFHFMTENVKKNLKANNQLIKD